MAEPLLKDSEIRKRIQAAQEMKREGKEIDFGDYFFKTERKSTKESLPPQDRKKHDVVKMLKTKGFFPSWFFVYTNKGYIQFQCQYRDENGKRKYLTRTSLENLAKDYNYLAKRLYAGQPDRLLDIKSISNAIARELE